MKVFNKENISYSEFLTGVKLLIDENFNNESFVSIEHIDETFDYLINLKNETSKKLLIKGVVSIDKRITESFENTYSFDAFHKLPLIVSLIRIVKEAGYGVIKDFTPEELSTLAAVTWSATEELYSRIVAVYSWKQIIDRLLQKSKNINDNLIIALETEKRAKVIYYGDIKMQILKICKFLDSLDEKNIQEILSKETYIKARR